MDSSVLLNIEDFRVYYTSVRGEYKVVDGVSFPVYKGEIVGLAGESGCGKSTLVEGLLRLVKPPGYIKSGSAISQDLTQGFGQSDLVKLTESEFRKLRWARLSYIPQGSMNSLNPVMKIEDQIKDGIIAHEGRSSEEQLQARVRELLSAVGLPQEVRSMYPHELSGGMKQRAIIATEVALRPQLIVADEPTTALDVTVQRIIIQTLARIQKELGAAIVLVTHDMPVHAQLADRLVIMYAGKVVEIGTVDDLFHDPFHPYSQGLVATIPSITGQRKRIEGIPGIAPSPLTWPSGCRFHPRCKHAMGICRAEEPEMRQMAEGRSVACHLYDG